MQARLRQIHVDGHTYTWRAALHSVQVNGFYHRAVYVRAWGSGGKNSQKLEADLLSAPGPYVVDNRSEADGRWGNHARPAAGPATGTAG